MRYRPKRRGPPTRLKGGFGFQPPQVADPPRPCPEPRQESDEYVCPRKGCGLRWDTHEDRPPCPHS